MYWRIKTNIPAAVQLVQFCGDVDGDDSVSRCRRRSPHVPELLTQSASVVVVLETDAAQQHPAAAPSQSAISDAIVNADAFADIDAG